MALPNKPHFLQIVLSDIIRERKLCIPREFVRKYGQNLSGDEVVLKVCDGVKWQVELQKDDGEIFMSNGFQDFMEYYSIIYGYYLVFAFDPSDSCFDVIIFDHTTSEIDYPIVEILDYTSSSSPERKPEEKTEFEVNKSGDKRSVSGQRSLTRVETMSCVHKIKTEFRSEYPYFVIPMQASFVKPLYNWPTISKVFAEKYISEGLENVILTGPDGTTWLVRCYSSVTQGRSTRWRFQKGWARFAEDNRLKAGDVCVFEMMKTAKLTFRVTIFRDVKS